MIDFLILVCIGVFLIHRRKEKDKARILYVNNNYRRSENNCVIEINNMVTFEYNKDGKSYTQTIETKEFYNEGDEVEYLIMNNGDAMLYAPSINIFESFYDNKNGTGYYIAIILACIFGPSALSGVISLFFKIDYINLILYFIMFLLVACKVFSYYDKLYKCKKNNQYVKYDILISDIYLDKRFIDGKEEISYYPIVEFKNRIMRFPYNVGSRDIKSIELYYNAQTNKYMFENDYNRIGTFRTMFLVIICFLIALLAIFVV